MRCAPSLETVGRPRLGVLGREALRERSEQRADEYPEVGRFQHGAKGGAAHKKFPA